MTSSWARFGARSPYTEPGFTSRRKTRDGRPSERHRRFAMKPQWIPHNIQLPGWNGRDKRQESTCFIALFFRHHLRHERQAEAGANHAHDCA